MTDGRRWPAYLLFLVAGLALGAAAVLLVRPDPATAPQRDVPGAVDIGFAQDMAQHHEQALAMSRLALTNTDTPTIVAVARQILLTQAEEKGTLQGWLTVWGAPVLPSGSSMSWVPGGAHTHGRMPGTATPAQLDRLARLHGRPFDRRFLVLMTRHHLGGIEMARVAGRSADLEQVRGLATLMVREQLEEVTTLHRVRVGLRGAGSSASSRGRAPVSAR